MVAERSTVTILGPDDEFDSEGDDDRESAIDHNRDDDPELAEDDLDNYGDMDALPEIPRAEGTSESGGVSGAMGLTGAPGTPMLLPNSPASSVVARMSERSLSRTVGMNAYQKGRGYARRGSVLDATIDGWSARGKVHGRASAPYEVRVEIAEGGAFTSACSCPAWRGPERHCKHVAALLVTLRDRLRALRDGPMSGASRDDGSARRGGRDSNRRGQAVSSAGQSHRRLGRHGEGELGSGPREVVVVVDRQGPRMVSASGTGAVITTVQSGGTVSNVVAEARTGWQVWLPPEDPKKAPEFEYRVTFKTMVIAVTAQSVAARAAINPELAIDSLGPYCSPHRPVLRALSRAARGGRQTTIDLRGEDAAEMLSLLRGKRVLIEPQLMELRFADDPLAPKMELELVPSGGVRVKIVFERKSDGRRFSIAQGQWFEGAPGWHIDTGQGIARPLTENLTPAWLERLSKAPSIVHPTEEMGRLLGEIVPRAALALNIELPDLAAIADLVDVLPTFVLHAKGDLTVCEVTLKAAYGDVELVVPPAELPPPMEVMASTDAKRPRPTVIRRDIGAERAAVDLLFERGLVLEDRDDVLIARGDKAVTFWTEGVGTLPDTWDRFIPEDLVDVTVRSTPVSARARVSSGLDWLALDVEFESEGSKVDEDDLRRAIIEGRRLVRLTDGTWAPVSREQVEDVLARMAEIFAQGRQKIPLSQAGRIQELLRLVPGARIEPSAKEILTALADRGGIEQLPVPKALVATLRPYQIEGFSWLAYLHRARTGGVLADDMGLGKTLEALTLLLWSRDADRAITPTKTLKAPPKKPTRTPKATAAGVTVRKRKAVTPAEPEATGDKPERAPTLVVAPTSVVTNWLREIERFAPSLKAIAWSGSDREKRIHEIAAADVVVTSYALMRRDEEILQAQPFGYVILDEAQNIKNPLSATARAAKKLRSERRLALTGTPIENRLSEIWSIFDFLSPGMLGDLSTFEERYSRPIDRGDAEATRRLRATIGPLVLRRTKSEVAKDLPERIVSELQCEMPTAQRSLYQQVLSQVRASLMGEIERVGVARSQIQILAALTRLRQAACDPRLLKLPGQFDDEDSGKLDALKEILSEAMQSGHRTLVFSQFVEMLSLIRAALERDGIKYEYLDGGTKDRQERVDRFNTDEAIPVFLISLKAGGSGLNLTGADTVVHFDPWWNPAVEDQATDRAHRIGQTRVVTAYRLIARGTIEEKIMLLSGKKRELMTSVLGADEGAVPKGLTRGDVDMLFAEE